MRRDIKNTMSQCVIKTHLKTNKQKKLQPFAVHNSLITYKVTL